MAQAGTATVKFVGDYSQLNAGLASALAPASLKKSGMKAGLAVGGAFAAAFVGSKVIDELGKAVAVTREFDKELSSLQAVTGSTGRQMEKLRKQAIDMGAATVFSASEAAKAQTELAKGGLTASQILGGALRSSLNLAAAGELELADAAEITVNSMKLFGLQGQATARVADTLAVAANRTTADVEDFGMALRQGGSLAKQAGLNFNDTVVVLEALAEIGVKNSDAGTSMKAAFTQLIGPTDKQRKLAEKLNLEFIAQNGQMKGAVGLARELREGLRGMSDAQRAATLKTLAGTDGFRTLAALYDAGTTKLQAFSRANREQGTAAEVAQIKTDNLAGDVEQLSGAYETLQIKVGTALTPVLRTATQAATDFVNVLNSIDPDTEIFGGTLGELAGDTFELGKAMFQFPVDADGAIKRAINVFAGDGGNEVSRLKQTMRARMEAVGQLRQITGVARRARGRAAAATDAERQAEANLRRARKRFGDGSDEVLRAEIQLQRAKRRTIRLTKEARLAERLQGVERRVVKERTRDQVVQEKARIGVLSRTIRTLGRKWNAERRNNGNTERARELEQQIIEKLKARDNTQKRLNEVLASAARQIGPKYARSLQNINVRQATFEKALGRLPQKAGTFRTALGQLPRPIEKVGRTARNELGVRATNALEDFAEAAVEKRRQINSNMRMMPEVQIRMTQLMEDDYLKRIGLLKNDGQPRQKKRAGGLVGAVRQAFGKGGVPVAVSPGEMFKTPDGKTGLVPGRPEPRDSVLTSMPVGTKVFTFDGQRRLAEGASEQQALRDQLPHFARGGIVKPEVAGGSPKARELANTAISNIHDKASERLKRARAAFAAPQGGSWRGGSGKYPGVTGDTDFMPALGNALSAMSKAVGQSIYVQSGWRSYAEQAALYQAYLNGTGNLAAPPGSSNHESGRAADITPGSEVFGSAAGRFGLGFTVPGESWHIELLRRGGLVGLLQRLVSGGQVVRIAAPILTRKGFDHKATAGIMGNAWGESSWNPAAMEPGTDNGGLFGFTAYEKSLANVRAYAAARGKPWTDVATQIGFMLHSGGMSLRSRLNALDSIPDTTKLFMDEYERPGIPRLEERIRGGFMASEIMRGMKLGPPGSGGGMSDRERSKAQRKARRESREEQVGKMLKRALSAKSSRLKKGTFWQILDLYAKYGEFGVSKGGMLGGGVAPGGKSFEAVEFLRRASGIASLTDPQRGAGQLYSLVKWLQENVPMTGVEDANERLSGKLERVRDRGGSRAEKKRKTILSAISKKGLDFPHKKRLLGNDRIVRTAEEWIELAERDATSESSPGGSDYTDAELDYQTRLYKSLLGTLRERRGLISRSMVHVAKQKERLEEQLKVAPAWKRSGIRKAIGNARSTLFGSDGLRSGMEELVGLTGRGGRIGEVRAALADLGVRETVEGRAAAGISFGDLRQIIEFAQAGGYDQLPKFHSGGVVPGVMGQEVPIMAQAGETVVPPGAMSMPRFTIVIEDGAVNADRIKLLADGQIMEFDRVKDQRAKAGRVR